MRHTKRYYDMKEISENPLSYRFDEVTEAENYLEAYEDGLNQSLQALQ